MGYMNLVILPNITAARNILKHTLFEFTSSLPFIEVDYNLCSQSMSMNGSPRTAVNMAPCDDLCGLQSGYDDFSGSLDSHSGSAIAKFSGFWKHTD